MTDHDEPTGRWIWCVSPCRRPHHSGEAGHHGHHGHQLAGPFHTRDEAVAFGTRTDPERNPEQTD
jgi:hypothetical protein